MRVSIWNSRGMGRKSFWPEVDAFCKIERINIIAIMETKTDKEPEENTWKKAGFDNFIWSPASGRVGGLCVMWKAHQLINEQIEVLIHEARFVILKCKNLDTNYVMIICFTYGPPQEVDKDIFWNQLTEIIKQINSNYYEETIYLCNVCHDIGKL